MGIVIAVWIICGIGAGAIASSKGRSGCGWLILGFFLGPLGLIISAGMSNEKQTAALARLQQTQSATVGELRACTVCAEQIQRAAVKCRFCGTDITPLPPPAPSGAGYDIGKFLGQRFSPLWLVALLIIVVIAVQSCTVFQHL